MYNDFLAGQQRLGLYLFAIDQDAVVAFHILDNPATERVTEDSGMDSGDTAVIKDDIAVLLSP